MILRTLAFIYFLHLLTGSAHGLALSFGSCGTVNNLNGQNTSICMLAGKTWYLAAEIPMMFENTLTSCTTINIASTYLNMITGNEITVTVTDQNLITNMTEMSVGTGMVSNSSSSVVLTLSSPIFSDSLNATFSINFDLVDTDESTYALFYGCMSFYGIAKNEGYYLLTNTTMFNQNLIDTFEAMLIQMGVDVSTGVVYDNSNCFTNSSTPAMNSTSSSMSSSKMSTMSSTISSTPTMNPSSAASATSSTKMNKQ